MQTALALSVEPHERAPVSDGLKIDAICRRAGELRSSATLAVNRALIQFYWEVGRALVHAQASVGSGERDTLGRLAAELQRRFPDTGGFGRASLWRAAEFYLAWYEQVEDGFHAPEVRGCEPLPAYLGALSWEDHGVLLECVPDPTRRASLARQAVAGRWTHAELCAQARLDTASGATPPWRSAVSPDDASSPALTADAHHLDMLALLPAWHARQRHAGQIEQVKAFLMHQEHGFAWAGDRVPVGVGRDDLTIDVLCYHLQLRRYVAFSLCAAPISQPLLDRLAFALAALDDRLRHADDKASIGVAVGWTGTRVEVTQALRGMPLPGVASTVERLARFLVRQHEQCRVVSARPPVATDAY